MSKAWVRYGIIFICFFVLAGYYVALHTARSAELERVSARILTQDDLRDADKYIQEIMGLPPYSKKYPRAITRDFPTDNTGVAATVKGWAPVVDGLVTQTEVVSEEGIIFIRKEFDPDDVFWKGILVHEMCHARDFFTKEGCGCDPYFIQYLYYLEHRKDMNYINEEFGFALHNPERACNVKTK